MMVLLPDLMDLLRLVNINDASTFMVYEFASSPHQLLSPEDILPPFLDQVLRLTRILPLQDVIVLDLPHMLAFNTVLASLNMM